jgi:hypothetical protein
VRVFFLFSSECFEDGQQHAFQILQHIVVPEAKYAEALRLERLRAGEIGLWGVLTAIDLDDQAAFEAAEVGDVLADGPLTAEFMAAELTGSKPVP